jgi:hypothetical protein
LIRHETNVGHTPSLRPKIRKSVQQRQQLVCCTRWCRVCARVGSFQSVLGSRLSENQDSNLPIVGPCVFLFLLFYSISICVSVCLYINLTFFVCLYICLCLSVYLSFSVYISVFVCLYTNLSLCLVIFISILS